MGVDVLLGFCLWCCFVDFRLSVYEDRCMKIGM